MKIIAANLLPLPPSDFFALPLQARAGLCATLRGQPDLALQSIKIGNALQTEVETSTTNT
jgi:hypothetical protein